MSVKDNIVKGKFNIPAYITQDAQDLLRFVPNVLHLHGKFRFRSPSLICNHTLKLSPERAGSASINMK